MQAESQAESTGQRPRWSLTVKVIILIAVLLIVTRALDAIKIVLPPLVIGGVVAYLLQPVVRLICRLTRLPHFAATSLLYVAMLALTVLIGILLTPILTREISDAQHEITAELAALTGSGQPSFTILGLQVASSDALAGLTTSIDSAINGAAEQAVDLLVNAAKLLLMTIFTFLIAFYLTADADKMVRWLAGLIPTEYRDDARRLLREMDEVWAAYFRGQVVLAMIVTVIITAMSTALGLPQPILLGALAGLLEFMVSLGHTIWIIIAVIVALLEGSTLWPIPNMVFAVMVAIAHLIFTKFDLSFLIPKITGGRLRLHPMVVLLGIIVGASVGGVLGIALAAPVIACLRILGRYGYAMLLDREPFLPNEETVPIGHHAEYAEAERKGTKATRQLSRRKRHAPIPSSEGAGE